VPNDGETEVILTVEVEDDNEDIDEVFVDLTTISGPSKRTLNDNGVGADISPEDGVWSISFKVSSSSSTGKKTLTITAEDETGQFVTSTQILEVTKANRPPSFGDWNMTDSDGNPSSQFSPGETVKLAIIAEDEDIEDIDSLRVTIDLTELDLNTVTMTDDDGDLWFTGEFTISNNQSAGNYNFTIRVEDNAGAFFDKRVPINIRVDEDAQEDQAISSEYAMYGGIAGFVVLVILVGAIIFRANASRKPSQRAGPPQRMPPQRPPYGNPYNPNTMR
jgi:hypothetical protein